MVAMLDGGMGVVVRDHNLGNDLLDTDLPMVCKFEFFCYVQNKKDLALYVPRFRSYSSF